MANGVATVFVLDNDGPPAALDPHPPHLSDNVPLDVDLSWAATEGELIVNGGFEDASLKGWTTFDSGAGQWLSANSGYNPPGPGGAQTPLAGTRYGLAAQFGNGTHELWQQVSIPEGVSNVVLSWSHRLKNFAPAWASNQQFRVELRDTANQPLATLFNTAPGDALDSGWTNRTASLNAWKGQSVRVVFIETDALGTLLVSLDSVSVFATPPAPTTWLVYFGTDPSPDVTEFLGTTNVTAWPLAPLTTNTTYYWQVKSVRHGGTNSGPVWQFTTVGTTNRPPAVALRFPGHLAVFKYPVIVTNSLNSLTDDGVVSKVEFWADGVKLGEDAVAPQTWAWTNPPLGPHHLWAVAQDSFGARGTSAVQHISIIPSNGTLQTLVPFGATWKYYDAGVNLGTAWRTNSYSDTHWASGPAQLGYGELDEATVVSFGNDPADKHLTTYFRHTFNLLPGAQALQTRVRRDDGVAVYFNGLEVLRNNLAAGAAATAPALSDLSGLAEAALVSAYFFPSNVAARGGDLLAVEVHQSSASSVDLSFDLELAEVLNLKPTVQLTSPASGSVLAWPATVPLAATAWDAYGLVTNVVFYADGAAIGTSSVAPYQCTWSNAPAGPHSLRAAATDDEGATNLSATVLIDLLTPPVITLQPTNQTVYLGAAATFTAGATGGAPLALQWRFNGAPLAGATNATLLLPSAQLVNTGQYSMRASNPLGFVDSTNATLTLLPLPSLQLDFGFNRLFLSWPGSAPEFQLERTTNLVPPVLWQLHPNGPALENGRWTITIPLDAEPQKFFRLRGP